jgi:hypothetical protein
MGRTSPTADARTGGLLDRSRQGRERIAGRNDDSLRLGRRRRRRRLVNEGSRKAGARHKIIVDAASVHYPLSIRRCRSVRRHGRRRGFHSGCLS